MELPMPLELAWHDIALRLLLTLIAGVIIGLNRETQAHAAGLRTTILIALAASVSMILVNLLLPTSGKTQDSFVNLDLMRLPSGILTGVGFIGGGAILKRDNLVVGVTTAATLWVMTVIGLCFGGGQLVLGVAATVLAVVALWVFKWVDLHLPRDHRATLVITAEEGTFAAAPDLNALISAAGYHARLSEQARQSSIQRPQLTFEIRWRRAGEASAPRDLLELIEGAHQVQHFKLIEEGTH
jgi:putative Mg2+ transporter-C (MgtC) family protein